MPTTLALSLGEADTRVRRNDALGVANNNRDLAVVAMFTVIGLAITIGLVVCFPEAASDVATALSVT